MAADTEIANAALIKLGAARIAALTDNNNRAKTLNERYTAIRKAELRRRRWRFAIERTTLAALTSTPAFGETAEYQLPVDYLSVIQIGTYDIGPDMLDYRAAPVRPWAIEGGKVVTSLGAPLPLRYIKNVTDVALMDDSFKEAFASRLAYECCETITQSSTKKQLAMADYRLAIREAIKANAIEAPAEYTTDDTWINARAQ